MSWSTEQEVWQQLEARPRGTPWEPLTLCLRELVERDLLCLTVFFDSTVEKERSPWYFSFPLRLNEMWVAWSACLASHLGGRENTPCRWCWACWPAGFHKDGTEGSQSNSILWLLDSDLVEAPLASSLTQSVTRARPKARNVPAA